VVKKRKGKFHGLTAYQKFSFLFLAVIFSFFFFWVIFHTNDLLHIEFWIASGIELGLLWFVFRIPMRLHFYRFLVISGAILIPTILAPNIENLRYIRLSPLVFGYVGAIYSLYYRATEKNRFSTPTFTKKPDIHYLRLPPYLPEGFKTPVINQFRKENKTISELIFNHDDSESIIWINESNGAVPGFARRKWTRQEDRILKGINVTISHQLRKGTPPVVEVRWSDSALNYVIRSDGLSVFEVEKVVTSMINHFES